MPAYLNLVSSTSALCSGYGAFAAGYWPHLQDGDALQVGLLARLLQLVRRLVDQRHVGRRNVLHDALGAEAGAAAHVHHLPCTIGWATSGTV